MFLQHLFLSLERDGDEQEVDANHATEFRQIVGALKYHCNTRRDLAFWVGLIRRVWTGLDYLILWQLRGS